jgi:polyhydroxyalkanoate synthesis repressor PhaR
VVSFGLFSYEAHLDKLQKPPARPSAERERRVIKRYSNRKLYDTRDSRYVTLLQIAEMIRAGEDVQIIDNASKEDKTEVTLALIISEELKSQPRSVPLVTLRNLIHQRGERLLSQLREGPIGRLIPGGSDGKLTEGGGPNEPIGTAEQATQAGGEETRSDATPEMPEGQPAQQMEARNETADVVGAPPAGSAVVEGLQRQIERLAARIAELEKRLAEKPLSDTTVRRGEDPP